MNDAAIANFLALLHPYDSLTEGELAQVAAASLPKTVRPGEPIYTVGDPLDGLFVIRKGLIEVSDASGSVISLLGPRNSFGERGLMRDGRAMTTARAVEDSDLVVLPAAEFRRLIGEFPAFARFFRRGAAHEVAASDLTQRKIGDLMTRQPVAVSPDVTVREAAALMRDSHVSSLGVVREGRIIGIVTTRDLTHRILAEAKDPATPVARVMTPDPFTLTPDSLGSDVLHLMLERRIGHIPVVEGGELIGMVTQTDLTRFQAVSSAQLVRDVASADGIAAMASVAARIPQLLAQLVGGHTAHEVVTRLVTDVADTVTRRLLSMAEAELGTPPVPYLWLACGSQGRQEQTSVSDQDNCLFIDDSATEADMAYFDRFARFVCDGLNACGYVYCPGEMMALTPRWRQPLRVWRDYFAGWIARPDPMAQMLASVMFDLRPIGGKTQLFADLQEETLALAARNSIFTAHMIANSLKHQPPLGLIRGLATIRSGEHKNRIDMKHNGVVPVVDLGRIYALLGRITEANTRARIMSAGDSGVISASGARDLTGAYDTIARIRLENQVRAIRDGEKPGNFLAPADLSDFERSHLRDAFVVVRTMQSAVGHGRAAPV
jgi:CBS domain-containing protein